MLISLTFFVLVQSTKEMCCVILGDRVLQSKQILDGIIGFSIFH